METRTSKRGHFA